MADDAQFAPDQISSARLGEVGRVWTSDLSVSEFALLDEAGFRPLEFVMGSSVFHTSVGRRSDSTNRPNSES
jgi:hypothetical protein